MTTFYMTLGSGQPYYPGYFLCIAEDENIARIQTSHALNGRWCSTYESLEDVHPYNRIYRGYIDINGVHEA
jgi:hypothetical protein